MFSMRISLSVSTVSITKLSYVSWVLFLRWRVKFLPGWRVVLWKFLQDPELSLRRSRTKLKDSEITPTTSGTPQGGVISPLLANIALHGLENHLVNYVGRRPGPSGRSNRGFAAKSKALGFVRYADDFVITHDNLEILNECIVETRAWLARMGLEISEEKSAVRDAREGFLFLGFQCIMIRRKYGNWRYKILIRPSNQSIRKLLDKVKVIIRRNKSASSFVLIEKLRPLMMG